MTEAEKIVNWARSKIGSSAWSGHCQGFVADAYANGTGKARQSKGTAAQARAAWTVSTRSDNIPIGATVYFSGSGSAGHVGIYSGNGMVIHTFPKVVETPLSKAGKFLGWGYNGGYAPEGAVTDGGAAAYDGREETYTSAKSGGSGRMEITTVTVKSITGDGGARKWTGLRDVFVGEDYIELLVQNDKIYAPVVVGTATLTRERTGAPAKLEFEVVKDEPLSFQEGNPVSLRVGGKKAFYGYVFKKERSDNRTIKVTCYDQLRYFKNKDTVVYTDKTYAQLVKMLADDFGLSCGALEDTGYVIKDRIEEGTLFDICANAADLTVINTGKLFVLYDDFGELTLKNISSMRSETLIDEDVCGRFSYTSSIDENTYNKIKLAHDNEQTGEREVYIVQDGETQSSWGTLQYYENYSDYSGDQLAELGEQLLKYYNRKQRKLTLSDCTGDIGIRGGSLVPVMLDLGDITVNNYMVVEKVTHKFDNGQHLMDLSVVGIRGEFVV